MNGLLNMGSLYGSAPVQPDIWPERPLDVLGNDFFIPIREERRRGPAPARKARGFFRGLAGRLFAMICRLAGFLPCRQLSLMWDENEALWPE